MVPLKCFRKFTLAFVFLLGGAAPLTSIAADPAPTPEAASAPDAAAPTTSEILTQKRVPVSGNPGAVNFSTGDGFLQSLTPIKPDSGVTLGGIWLSDYNVLISGGAEPGASSWNSLLILSLMVDAEKLVNWQGAEFGIQFLQFNGENTNGQAGSVQGYNGLPGAPPLDRSELYQLWYLQKFGDLLAVRIGRTVPTYDFNNVTRPAPTQDPTLQIPAVSGLIFTPIFVNPTMLGALPGYYNSANGLTVNFTPFKNIYFNYGFYDGNLANGVQTGMVGPLATGPLAASGSLRIITPARDSTFRWMSGLDAGAQQIPLTAAGPGPGEPLHWFVNDRPIGVSRAGEPLFWPLERGAHQIVCSAVCGLGDRIRIVVE